ncbi:MAG TPA: type I methionyl aminopeptidase [Mycobacteriales bacterium]|nr:type I methionyl aminopeptidase [Mycobacteriales bacterium]
MDHTLPIRTATELDSMRAAGRVVAEVLAAVRAAAVPGVKLRELDDLARTVIDDAGATPSFLGYAPSPGTRPYDGVLCLSPNEVVVHGRPSGRRLHEGDLLTVDGGAIVDGWHGDSAITVHIGPPAAEEEALRLATEEALAAGIGAAVPGATLRDVAVAIDAVARKHGYEQLADHGGHGIGQRMHEPPFIANQPTDDAARYRLRAGNTIAIEPMLVLGAGRYKRKRDGWAVLTADGSRAAHAEHTVLVAAGGGEILTRA